MKELEDLNTFEKAVLLTCCDANNFSLSSHVPIEAITRRFRDVSSRYIKKVIKLLLASGFIVKHPTRGNTTYQLGKKGLKAGYHLKKEYKDNIK